MSPRKAGMAPTRMYSDPPAMVALRAIWGERAARERAASSCAVTEPKTGTSQVSSRSQAETSGGRRLSRAGSMAFQAATGPPMS